MDRRRLLKGAAAAAASLVVAGSLTQRDIREAKAASFHDLSGTASTEYGIGVEGMSSEGHGVQGTNAADDPDNAAVYGRNGGPGGGTGVQGDSLVGTGVVGNGGPFSQTIFFHMMVATASWVTGRALATESWVTGGMAGVQACPALASSGVISLSLLGTPATSAASATSL